MEFGRGLPGLMMVGLLLVLFAIGVGGCGSEQSDKEARKAQRDSFLSAQADSLSQALEVMSREELVKHSIAYVDIASALFKKYGRSRASDSAAVDPYETREVTQARERESVRKFQENLSNFSKLFEPKHMKVRLDAFVRYSPDKKSASVRIAKWDKDYRLYATSSRRGYASRRRQLRLVYSASPLIDHGYSYTSNDNHTIKLGSVSVDMSIETAKRLDVINNPGQLECIFKFGLVPLVVKDYKGYTLFPSMQLVSAKWIVNQDTLMSKWGFQTSMGYRFIQDLKKSKGIKFAFK